MRNRILSISVWILLVAAALSVGCVSSSDEGFEDKVDVSLGGTPEDPAPENQQTISEDPSGEVVIRSEIRRGMDTAFIEACGGKKAGEVCVLRIRNTSVSGSCMDRNGTLICQLLTPSSSKRMEGPGGIEMPRVNGTIEGYPTPPKTPGEPMESL